MDTSADLGIELGIGLLVGEVGFTGQQRVVLLELSLALRLLQLSLDAKGISESHELLIGGADLVDLSWWRNLEAAELLNHDVVQLDAVVVLVVEGRRTVPLALLLLVLLL